jgi:murein DD-endopeptidase MepM/ murein hydrolase activator NlpD
MNDPGDTSFDPRTWGRSDAPGEASFDPRSWAGAADPSPEPVPVPPRDAPAPARPSSRRGWTAIGSTIAVLLAGAATAYVTRQPQVVVAPVQATATTSAPAVIASRRTLIVAAATEVAPALSGSGVPAEAVAAVQAAVLAALGNSPGEVRMEFDLVEAGTAQRLTRLSAARDDGSGVVLTIKPDGTYASEVQQAQLETVVRIVRGEMDANSFYNAAVTAGLTDSLVSPFAAAFAFDFDFQREVKPGDIFEAAFEQKVNPQGQAVGAPTLIYASLATPAKSRALYRFLAPGETEPGWFDGNGHSIVRSLMRTPVDGARISSAFGPRIHPVQGFLKLHKGTDFAAPTGTPIFASGDAVVRFAAMKGANGNLTILAHDNGWLTYYLHQSEFMPGIEPGLRVRQGQEIGKVGTTGRSTGPHLHYEVHIDGAPVDPMSIETSSGLTLTGGALTAFKKERDRIDTSRAGSIAG